MNRKYGFSFLPVALVAITLSSVATTNLANAGPVACGDVLTPRGVDEFEIHNRTDLDELLNDANALACSGKTILLAATINLNGWSQPIDLWYGTFDGNEKSFVDSTTGSSESPLFNFPGGAITINDVHRTGNVEVDDDRGGSLVHGGSLICESRYDVVITNSSIVGDVTGGFATGGIVGIVQGDLTITNSSMRGNVESFRDTVGGLIGAGWGPTSKVTIADSTMEGEVRSEGRVAGGLLGDGQIVTITRSSMIGDVLGEIEATGGLVGNGNTVTIEESSVVGNVQGDQTVGGLVGYANVSAAVTGSSVNGDIHGTNDGVGGLIGESRGSATIRSTTMNGDVEGESRDTGGFVGSSSDRIEVVDSTRVGDTSGDGKRVGGFVGNAPEASFTNSSVTGNVEGSDESIGGFIGLTNGDITVTSSSMTGDVTGDAFNVGGYIGWLEAGFTATISDSSVVGGIEGIDGVGGFVGYGSYDPDHVPPLVSSVEVDKSYKVGNVTGEDQVGGFVGRAGSAEIDRSYSVGTNSGTISVGGLIGSLGEGFTISRSFTNGDSLGSAYVGGLVGETGGAGRIEDSYTTGEVTGDTDVGGLIGYSFGDVTVENSYTIGNVSGSADVGGAIGRIDGTRELVSVFCLDGKLGCDEPMGVTELTCLISAASCGDEGVLRPTTEAELKSEDFYAGLWDFANVWCIRGSLNNGFPVLRVIDFGPGDTNNCRPRRSPSALQSITLDSAGGTCGDHTSPWTQTFRRSFTLPTANDCQRDGYAFLGWTRDPSLTTPENLLTNTVTRSGTLTAVWGALPASPTRVDVIANFLCVQNCTSAIVVWPTSTNPTDTVQITIDNSEAVCSFSGQVFGLDWCWVTGLTAGASHNASVSWRNQYGSGPAATAEFALA